MSIDHYFVKDGNSWRRLDAQAHQTEYYVDISHSGVDERYYFASFSEAEQFYNEGWQDRQFLDSNDVPCRFDSSRLYVQGELFLSREAPDGSNGRCPAL